MSLRNRTEERVCAPLICHVIGNINILGSTISDRNTFSFFFFLFFSSPLACYSSDNNLGYVVKQRTVTDRSIDREIGKIYGEINNYVLRRNSI